MSEKCCEPGCKKVVMPAGHSPPLAHYSPAILAGDTLYISGQLGIDADGNLVHDTCPVKQTNQAMENMGAILKAAGMSYEHVVKATVLLADIKDSPKVNDEYKKFFPKNPPARACYAVAHLPKSALVEIEAIAVKPGCGQQCN